MHCARQAWRGQRLCIVNQIAASFAYWTRMINGLGISLGTENIGLAPETLTGIMKGADDMSDTADKPRRRAGRRKSSRVREGEPQGAYCRYHTAERPGLTSAGG